MKMKVFMFITNILFGKEVKVMKKRAKLLASSYAFLIIDGFMTFDELWDWLKEATKEALVKLGRGDLVGVTDENGQE